MTNAILEELYDIRREILAEHQDDLTDYLRSELTRTRASGHPVAKIKQRTIRCTEAAKSDDSQIENLSSPLGDR